MNVKADTQKFYSEQINRVMAYISNHLSEPLDMEALAGIGNYSSFHFHRIMRAYLGESLGACIVRLRLETSVNLLRYTDLPIADIAFKVGYENPPSFNKAFKKRYGISPNEFRQDFASLMITEHSKIHFNAMETLKSLEPKIKVISPKKVIYAEVIGSYNETPKIAWDKVCGFAQKNRLFGFRNEFIGISHDDPKITEPDRMRYDACIVIHRDAKPEGDIGVKEIAGGKYAVFTHKGPYENFTHSYDYIFGKWIRDNSIELRDEPGFELYLNSPDNTKPEKLLTEIWIPIKD
jgi:AraC family transcriptional regulator